MARCNKYFIGWQITRIRLKAIKDINEKLEYARIYLASCNEEDKERLLNWVEGLSLGYKSRCEISYNLVKMNIEKFKKIKCNNEYNKDKKINEYSFKDRYELLKDLFKRTKKWAVGNYEHKVQTQFILEIYSSFNKGELSKIDKRYNLDSFKKLLSTIDNSKAIKHKFLY